MEYVDSIVPEDFNKETSGDLKEYRQTMSDTDASASSPSKLNRGCITLLMCCIVLMELICLHHHLHEVNECKIYQFHNVVY